MAVTSEIRQKKSFFLENIGKFTSLVDPSNNINGHGMHVNALLPGETSILSLRLTANINGISILCIIGFNVINVVTRVS